MGFVDCFILLVGLLSTIAAVIMAVLRQDRQDARTESVAGRSLGPYVLALGAGATANSGFVLTGAVGLGYTGGMVWCLLPLGWLIGDIIFWQFLAHRLHQTSVSSNSISLVEMIVKAATPGYGQKSLPILLGLTIAALTALYVTAQWLAAAKIGGWIFDIPDIKIGLLFAVIVIGYTTLSGVRGAAYTDFIQGCIMLLLVACLGLIVLNISLFGDMDILSNAPENFLSLAGDWPAYQVILTLLGFALLSISFNLGQPQMVNRWMSARSDVTIRKARWIYIAFLQLTWFSYTALGAFIRLIMDAPDPEQALVGFIQAYAFPGLMGLFITGAIATIASTASALLAVSGDILATEVLPERSVARLFSHRLIGIAFVGVISICGIFISGGKVYSTAITAASLLGASMAAPILFAILNRRMTTIAIIIALFAGLISSAAWKVAGYDTILNESGIGFGLALLILFCAEKFTPMIHSHSAKKGI